MLLTAEQEADDGHVLEGALKCDSCGTSYPIRAGVPRLITGSLAEPERKTQVRFGFQWQWYRVTGRAFATEFWDYLKPIQAEELRGKVVLDAGCGNGRLALEAAGARDVIGVDFSESVEVAFEATRSLPNLHIVHGNIMELPLRGTVDFIYCIGVLHHLESPESGFRQFVKHLVPGGTIAIWVYSLEGNEWFLRFVEPLRRHITAKLPLPLVRILALPPAAALWLASIIARSFIGQRIALSLGDYLRFQGQFGFAYLWLTVFDKLIAPTAYYLSEREIRGWLMSPSLRDPAVSYRNNSGWRVKATRVLQRQDV